MIAASVSIGARQMPPSTLQYSCVLRGLARRLKVMELDRYEAAKVPMKEF